MVAPTTPSDALVRKRLREFFNGSPDSPINLSYLLSDASSSGKKFMGKMLGNAGNAAC
jgi:hypothetical protein